MAGAFTRVGGGLWDWEPFTSLPDQAQILWLGLYTTNEAKRIVPGLWHGSIATMADAVHKRKDDVLVSLDKLLEREMVDYDQQLRVLRLTKLPDAGESPTNGNTIRGWWRRFNTVPGCAVRDEHVALLRWIMEQWSRENGKPYSQDHAKAWSETFGRMEVPIPKRRGVRRLVDSDTSTPVQPSLFLKPPESPPEGLVEGSLTYPLSTGHDVSVDNSDSLHQLNNIRTPERYADTFPKEREKDQDQDLSSSYSGEGRSPSPEPPDLGAHVRAERERRPALTLVPMSGFDADDLAEAMPRGFPRALTRDARDALSRAISQIGESARRHEVLAVLGDYIARGVARVEGLGEISPDTVAAPGWLALAIQKALTWKTEADRKSADLAAARAEAGV